MLESVVNFDKKLNMKEEYKFNPDLSDRDLAKSYLGYEGAELIRQRRLLLVAGGDKSEDIKDIKERIEHNKLKFSQVSDKNNQFKGVLKLVDKYSGLERERRARIVEEQK